MNAAPIPRITPVNDRAGLSELAAKIAQLMGQREDLNEAIRATYRAAADLGAPKEGFRLAVRCSRMAQEKLEDMQRGYKAGADALGLQGELF